MSCARVARRAPAARGGRRGSCPGAIGSGARRPIGGSRSPTGPGRTGSRTGAGCICPACDPSSTCSADGAGRSYSATGGGRTQSAGGTGGARSAGGTGRPRVATRTGRTRSGRRPARSRAAPGARVHRLSGKVHRPQAPARHPHAGWRRCRRRCSAGRAGRPDRRASRVTGRCRDSTLRAGPGSERDARAAR